MALSTFRSNPVGGSGGGGAGISVQSAAATTQPDRTGQEQDVWGNWNTIGASKSASGVWNTHDTSGRRIYGDEGGYTSIQQKSDSYTPSVRPAGYGESAPAGGGEPQPQLPAVGGVVPAGAGGAGNVPAGGGSPAMAGLSGLALGEGLKEGFNREGWGDQGTPDLTVPGQRTLPASSRALAQLVSQGGKAY